MPKHQRQRVVKAKRMVGVRVREQDCAQVIESDAQGLGAKVRRGVDKDLVAPMLDQDRGAQALVAWVLRETCFALAPHHRNADRGAGSQKADLHLLEDIATNCIRRSVRMLSSRFASSGVRFPRVLVWRMPRMSIIWRAASRSMGGCSRPCCVSINPKLIAASTASMLTRFRKEASCAPGGWGPRAFSYAWPAAL